MKEIDTPDRLSKQAKTLYEKGNFLEAAKAFQSAQSGFAALGDELNAAEMANNASVAYLQAHEAEAAFSAAVGTPEVFARCNDLKRQGMALGNLASAAEAVGNEEEALNLYQQAADILAQVGEDQLRASVMQSLSMLQLKTGRQLQALTSMQSGVSGVKNPTPKQSFIKKLLRVPINLITRSKP